MGKGVDPRPPGIAAELLDLKQTNHTMILYLWVPSWLPAPLPRDVGKGLYNSYLSDSQMLFPTRAFSLGLPFFGIGMKTDLFQSCGYC